MIPTTGARSHRGWRSLAGAGLAIIWSFLAAGLVLAIMDAGTPGAPPVDGNAVGGAFMAFTYGTIGWLVASRRPDNAVGWVLLVVGLSQATEAFVSSAAIRGLLAAPGSIPFADLVAWMAMWAWVPGYSMVATFALLLFPDGRLPSRRWRPVALVALAGMLLVALPVMIVAWPLRGVALIPSGQEAAPVPDLAMAIENVGMLLIVAAALASVASVVVRFRRARGLVRTQLTWFGWGASITILWLIVGSFVTLPSLLGVVLAILVVPLLPGSMAVAILRYRLFDIDRIVSRTIGWLAVTAVLAAVFVGGVLLAQAVLEPVTGGSTIGVAASTLLAAALFSPVRSRVQRAVDRRFNRARYDAERTAAAFADRLRDEVDLVTLRADLGGVVARTLEPTSLQVWVREGAAP